jgi:chromosome segregation ATPase
MDGKIFADICVGVLVTGLIGLILFASKLGNKLSKSEQDRAELQEKLSQSERNRTELQEKLSQSERNRTELQRNLAKPAELEKVLDAMSRAKEKLKISRAELKLTKIDQLKAESELKVTLEALRKAKKNLRETEEQLSLILSYAPKNARLAAMSGCIESGKFLDESGLFAEMKLLAVKTED